MAKKERDDLDEALDGRDRDDSDDDRDEDDVADSDDSDDDDQDESDDDAEEDRPAADRRTKAELLAELNRKERALKRARREARNAKRQPATTRPPAARRPAADDDDAPAPRAASDERKLTRARTERSQAKGESALLKAGADVSLVELAVTKLGADDVDWQDEDDVSEWVDEMKDRYPALFNGKRRAPDDEDEPTPRRRRAPSVDQDASAPRRREVKAGGFGASVIAAGRRADAPTSRRRR